MNYYKRHLGDYAKDTRHLSLVEHGAYCLLLDYYYATEKPIPDDRCERIANAYADFEREAVRSVLREFFVQSDAGWVSRKADEVIAEAATKSLKAKGSAEARWNKSQCERNANASETHSDGNASHKPLATTKEIPPAVPAVAPVEPAKPAKPKAKRPPTITDWLASLNGAKAIPADDKVYDYAERTGIPDDFLALSWMAFKDAYSASGKRQKDFPATYRNAVKGNWYKLWWFDAANGGECRLTTAGEQARRAAQ